MSDLPLEVRRLALAYDGKAVLAGVDLDVHPAEFVTVLGPSGSGKSTLLRSIAGLVRPSAGTIRISGELVFDRRERVLAERRGVGLVFQDYALFPYQTVRENIAFGLPRGDHARVDELLALVDMQELAERLPSELSGGQQQRVALARSLAPRPRLLLLDEPFANVDAALRLKLGEELRDVTERQGTSVLMVTHERGEALALSDRLAVLSTRADGGATLPQLDTPELLYERPANAECAQALGVVDLIAAQASGDRAQTALGEARLLEPASGPVVLVARPERLQFVPTGDGAATVVRVVYQGHRYLLELDSPAGGVTVQARGEPPAPGTRGHVRFGEPCWALPREGP